MGLYGGGAQDEKSNQPIRNEHLVRSNFTEREKKKNKEMSLYSPLFNSNTVALLAQWIARWTSNPKVAGSSPAQGNLFEYFNRFSGGMKLICWILAINSF